MHGNSPWQYPSWTLCQLERGQVGYVSQCGPSSIKLSVGLSRFEPDWKNLHLSELNVSNVDLPNKQSTPGVPWIVILTCLTISKVRIRAQRYQNVDSANDARRFHQLNRCLINRVVPAATDQDDNNNCFSCTCSLWT